MRKIVFSGICRCILLERNYLSPRVLGLRGGGGGGIDSTGFLDQGILTFGCCSRVGNLTWQQGLLQNIVTKGWVFDIHLVVGS